MSRPDAVTLEVRRLEGMDLQGVRAIWRRRYGAAPTLRSPELMRRILAWRIQADAYGGLSPKLKRRLRCAGSPRERALLPGVSVAREWKGVRHDVQVTDTGYVYQGETFVSLSAIARLITGARWNGPRFFGLRGEEA